MAGCNGNQPETWRDPQGSGIARIQSSLASQRLVERRSTAQTQLLRTLPVSSRVVGLKVQSSPLLTAGSCVIHVGGTSMRPLDHKWW